MERLHSILLLSMDILVLSKYWLELMQTSTCRIRYCMHVRSCKVKLPYASILLILASELVSLSPVLCAQSTYPLPPHCSINISLNTNCISCKRFVQDGYTAFFCAALRSHFGIVQLLLQQNADINICDKVLKYFTPRGVHINVCQFWRPCMLTYTFTQFEVCICVPISTIQNGFSPLYVASQVGRIEVVESMLKSGADPNQIISVRRETSVFLSVSCAQQWTVLCATDRAGTSPNNCWEWN